MTGYINFKYKKYFVVKFVDIYYQKCFHRELHFPLFSSYDAFIIYLSTTGRFEEGQFIIC
jgi:hypothetical protein